MRFRFSVPVVPPGKGSFFLCFSTVEQKRTVPVLVPGNGSGGCGSPFGSRKNGSDGSGFGPSCLMRIHPKQRVYANFGKTWEDKFLGRPSLAIAILSRGEAALMGWDGRVGNGLGSESAIWCVSMT